MMMGHDDTETSEKLLRMQLEAVIVDHSGSIICRSPEDGQAKSSREESERQEPDCRWRGVSLGGMVSISGGPLETTPLWQGQRGRHW